MGHIYFFATSKTLTGFSIPQDIFYSSRYYRFFKYYASMFTLPMVKLITYSLSMQMILTLLEIGISN